MATMDRCLLLLGLLSSAFAAGVLAYTDLVGWALGAFIIALVPLGWWRSR